MKILNDHELNLLRGGQAPAPTPTPTPTPPPKPPREGGLTVGAGTITDSVD